MSKQKVLIEKPVGITPEAFKDEVIKKLQELKISFADNLKDERIVTNDSKTENSIR